MTATPQTLPQTIISGLLALAVFCATSGASAASPRLAPAFTLKTPQGGTVNFPKAAQGRPTVLMFWPSWCPFSRALQPYVNDIWRDYKNAGVNVWTINIKEDQDPVAVMRERGLSFPLLINGDAVAQQYGVEYTPWLVVIDAQNRIVYTRPPSPPTPVHTAREVRGVLNGLLGKRALALPKSYPKPYDLHLKDPATRNQRLAPKPVAQQEWGPWVQQYLAGVAADEAVKGVPPRGAIADGKTAISHAREIWTRKFGEEKTRAAAPYRAYRKDNRWVVLGDGLEGRLGSGLILVIDADSGRVIRIAQAAL